MLLLLHHLVRLFSEQKLEGFKLVQAERAARFALRHNGQEPADRLLGATRALTAAITALVAERSSLHTRGRRSRPKSLDILFSYYLSVSSRGCQSFTP